MLAAALTILILALYAQRRNEPGSDFAKPHNFICPPGCGCGPNKGDR